MPIDLGDYQPFRPGAWGPLHQMPRKQAKAVYDKAMAEKEDRLAQLGRLVAPYGIKLDWSDEELDRLDHWFRANLRPNPENPEQMESIWYAIAYDIALYMSDLVIRKNPHLHWVFYDKGGPGNLNFQRHVLMGYTKVANPKYNFDSGLLVAALGHQVIAGVAIPNSLVDLVNKQAKYA